MDRGGGLHRVFSAFFWAIGAGLAIIAVVTAIAVPASPAAGPDDGPVAAFSFVEGEGTTAEDVTGDGHGLGCLFETQIGENRLNPDT